MSGKVLLKCAVAALVCMFMGAPLAAAGAGGPAPAVKMLFDFENGKAAPFENGTITTRNVPDGKYGLLCGKEPVVCNRAQDWSGYDTLKIDVFNPSDDPVMLMIDLRDAQTKDYWTRVNYETAVPPGKSTVSLPADMYVGEKSRPGRPLIKSKVIFMGLSAPSPLVFDDIRLERRDTSAVMFEGLHAFDFGTAKSPVMAGYTGVDDQAAYDKTKGYGWERSNYLHGFDGVQPDSLFEDFVAADGGFRVDLPNGKYHAIMNIDSPGGFWGEVQRYTSRQVSVNGKLCVDEKMTLDQFKARYFRNAHHEDLPGLDTFREYVQSMFGVKEFDFEVTGGKAEFEFKGQGFWPVALSALVIYPVGKSVAGRKFWDWTTEQRKEEFNNYFKQIVPKAVGAKAPAEGYRLFARNFMTPPNAYDGPRPGEEIKAEGLALSVARDEDAALTFSVQPSGDLGAIDVSVSDLAPAGGGGKSLPFKAGNIQVGWLDYRIARVTMDGTVYTVSPRYWHPGPAPAAPKVTRTFWLRVKAPAGAAPGVYQGTISVKPAQGAARAVPFKLTVLPFALDPITDVAVGPFGSGISLPWDPSDPKTRQWDDEMLGKSLKVIHEAGCTTVTGLPQVKMRASGGKVTFDFARADQQMKLLRDNGFNQMIDSYGASLGYEMYGNSGGPDVASAKKAGFADMDGFLNAVYGGIEEHAKASHWLPVAWNLCDEPVGAAINACALNAQAHEKVLDELHLKYSLFTGATSMEGDNPRDPHYALVQALTMPSLNLHDEGVIRMIQASGHRFSFYNGGNRWTFGRYMKALVAHDGLAYRANWHFNNVMGDPYYALDCREDDYCWYNTDAQGAMIPSVSLLAQIIPGLNDYRYLSTLQRLLKENGGSPAAAEARKIYDAQLGLVAGKDRPEPEPAKMDADRAAVVQAILSLVKAK